MRKYTSNLIESFHKICNDNKNKTGLKRIALGLAISLEAGLNLILRDSQGVYTKDSPLFSEIAAAFRELIEKDWVKEIEATEDDKFLYYADYGKYIGATGLSVYSNPENIEIELKLFPWPLGPNWFLLTVKGEEFINKNMTNKEIANEINTPPVFPNIIPDKITEGRFYTLENDDFSSEKEVEILIREMYEYPERSFYLYIQHEKQLNKHLEKAKNNNEILINECEFFYYPHPKNKRDFVKIQKNDIQFDWERMVIETSPMYKRFKLVLSEKKKRELNIQEINRSEALASPFELKPNFYGLGVDLRKIMPWFKNKFKK